MDTLFVVKPIGKYEPVERTEDKEFNPDPMIAVKALTSKPSSHAVVRDCNLDLDGE
jgi:hypothetical protein